MTAKRVRDRYPQQGLSAKALERLVVAGVIIVLLGIIIAGWARSDSATGAGAGVVAPGKPAPDFTVPGLEGGTVTLSNYRGRVVLVNFWATWCPPCRAEMPELETVYRQQRDAGFVILGIDQAENDATVRDFVTGRGFSWTFALDRDGAVSRVYGALGLPTSVLVDRDGRIVHTWSGALTRADLERRLAELGIGR